MKSFLETADEGPGKIVFLAFVFLFPFAIAVSAVDREITDENVRDVIERELVFESGVQANDVTVTVSDGIVSLAGRVNHLLAKERAADVARAVKGVRSVVNRLEVQPARARSDDEILSDVTNALKADPATEGYEVRVAVTDGKVTLSGSVDSWREKDLVATVAKAVRGVEELENELNVNLDAIRPDAELRAEIERALEWDVLVDDGLIEVRVEDGLVSLVGTVGSAAEKNRALVDARVTGVIDVDGSKLEVARWARDDALRKHKYTTRTDDEIRRGVEDALLRDPRVNPFDVTTRVNGGVVTLRGEVSYLKAKRAAEQDASNTVGVLRVENHIKVRSVAEILGDGEIRADVVDALERDSVLESYEIEVEVKGGRVTLDGEVDTYFEKYHADEVASRVDGVVWVENNLEVDYDARFTPHNPYVGSYYFPLANWDDLSRPATLRSDLEITREVEEELFWSPFVDSDDVRVAVDDGVATLTGRVSSWAEASAAIEAAYQGGAIRIDNDLVVSPAS